MSQQGIGKVEIRAQRAAEWYREMSKMKQKKAERDAGTVEEEKEDVDDGYDGDEVVKVYVIDILNFVVIQIRNAR